MSFASGRPFLLLKSLLIAWSLSWLRPAIAQLKEEEGAP